jgi:hypothetical protein
MSKRELIDQILQHNRTAAPEFLARFAETDLKKYLDRVVEVESPRKPSIWVRPGAGSAGKREFAMS